MSRFTRMTLFLVGGGCVAAMLTLAFLDMPAFGGSKHPYRDHAVAAAVQHGTANVVSAVNFDQRGIDTFGEETIMLGSVVGVAMLLRPGEHEHEEEDPGTGRVLDSTRLAAYLVLAVTMVVGLDVVIHGAVTPGGGFQGGVVLATGAHLLYVGGRYPALRRVTPEIVYEIGESFGAAAFAGLGIAGIAVSGAFLANLLPNGTFGQLFSAGSVPLLSIAVGIEVACGTVVLLAQFLRQELVIRPNDSGDGSS